MLPLSVLRPLWKENKYYKNKTLQYKKSESEYIMYVRLNSGIY